MNKLRKLLSSRLVIWGIMMLLQIGWFISIFSYFNTHFRYAGTCLEAIAVLIVLTIVNKQTNPSYKVAWSVLMLGVPVLGIAMYFLFGRSDITKRNRKNLDKVHTKSIRYLNNNEDVLQELATYSRGASKQSGYISKWSHFPVYKNQGLTYYATGDDTLKPILAEIEKAKHYIFLEFFIIREGIFFNTILDALEAKVKQGVEVRLMYDDFGSANTVPHHYDRYIEHRGIACVRFNTLKPLFSAVMNNRDHRKMIIIDGKVAFTGGFNLADEYINKRRRFGHWKDNGLRIEGEAVANFVAMFLEMWQYSTGVQEEEKAYFPVYDKTNQLPGFVQPFADSPLDHEKVGETVYLNIINRAKDYLYIFTPYLIIDNEMMTALCNAAKSGVDVRIVTPGIPDKKLVFLLTQSYYSQLLQAGVRIYQYGPGFIHAKTFVCDDVIATVGTINLDYRSLYMHFECGVWMYGTWEVGQIKQDALETFRISKEITYAHEAARSKIVKTLQGILRLFAPIM
ncbi:MAG: cardiolipin synthase [Lachnospiraceae bacterium]|jgi:cardiolipin synthase|nr:cardiolipin synthase [Lachnospiraceae bacterium]